jgi:hypothetical protein
MQEALRRIESWERFNALGLYNMLQLYLDSLNLTELPPIPQQCLWLSCNNNKLTSLPDLPHLERLDCAGNLLTQLPDLPNCETLNCADNKLTFLPRLPKCRNIDYSRNKYLYIHFKSTKFTLFGKVPPNKHLNIINYNKHARVIQRAYKKYRIRKYKQLLTTHLLKDPSCIVCTYI